MQSNAAVARSTGLALLAVLASGPFVAAAIDAEESSKCTDADAALWKADVGLAKWVANMTSCGKRCMGQDPCMTSCMAGDGWSTGCASCFGKFTTCKNPCTAKCKGSSDPQCEDKCAEAAGCFKSNFGPGSCSGLPWPGPLAVETAKCTDADTALWKADSDHSKWQANMTSCGKKCLGGGSCVASCMAGDGWSSGCASCFGDLTECTKEHCLMKCIGGRTPGCVSCLEAAGCDKSAFGPNSCTGFAAPSSLAEDFDLEDADLVGPSQRVAVLCVQKDQCSKRLQNRGVEVEEARREAALLAAKWGLACGSGREPCLAAPRGRTGSPVLAAEPYITV